MKTCKYCECEFHSEDTSMVVCSSQCKQVQEMSQGMNNDLVDVGPTEDARIFFYPLSFGRLMDEYVTLSLKRANTKSIRNQQDLDFSLFKIRKSIHTNLGQLAYSKPHRISFGRLLDRLFNFGSIIWRYNDLCRSERVPGAEKMRLALKILEFNDKRHRTIREIDILYQGKTTHLRIYLGAEF